MPQKGYKWSEEAIKRKTLREQWKHERNMAIIDLVKNDPSWFYKVGLVTGSIVTAAAAAGMLVSMTSQQKKELEETDKKGIIFPDGVMVPGMGLMFVGGITFSAWCAFMLTFPVMFGTDGLQFKGELSGPFGTGGEVELG